VPLADKKLDFSRLFSAPAIQKYRRNPMSSNGNDFEILVGRIGNRDPPRELHPEVLRARRQAGVEPGSMTGRRVVPWGGSLAFGGGRTAFSRSRLLARRTSCLVAFEVGDAGRQRRGPGGPQSRAGLPLATASPGTDAMAFARRLNDRYHLGLVVTPEDAAEMTDL
jgi:hypothetical protein